MSLAAQPMWQWAVSTGLVRERVIGLFNLAEIAGDGCGFSVPKFLPLYGRPSLSAAIGRLECQVVGREPDGSNCHGVTLFVHRNDGTPDEQLPSDERGYEEAAAIVYERSGEWFRIALQSGSAWIHQARSDRFEPYPELLIRKGAYLRRDWDGRLWSAPGSGQPTMVPASWTQYIARQIPVNVRSVRRVAGATWVQVELQTERCGEEFTGTTAVTGWVPAYQSSSATSLWFYSRGC